MRCIVEALLVVEAVSSACSLTHAFSFRSIPSPVALTSPFSFTPVAKQQKNSNEINLNRKSGSILTCLHVSASNIGLGPDEKVGDGDGKKERLEQQDKALVADIDYEVPDHESHRTDRRSKTDEQCDVWFGTLLGENDGVLGSIAKEARERLLTPVELKNEERLPFENEEWTPYVDTKLPWTPLYPAFGLEQYGLPVPRRNAETWRHFDVLGMIQNSYSKSPDEYGTDLTLSDEDLAKYKEGLENKGGWLDDESCQARLIYVNGRFCPQLSKTSEHYKNIESEPEVPSDEAKTHLGRLTDGFTDELATPVPSGKNDFLTSYNKLSGPDHSMGDPNGQFAINVQQGTACFAALNTAKTGAVAYIHQPIGLVSEKPVLLVNAFTNGGGVIDNDNPRYEDQDVVGVSCHPRALIIAEENSKISLVQSSVDLDSEVTSFSETNRPKLHNGYTQIFVKESANLTYSYLEETGGIVTPGVEQRTTDFTEKGETPPNEIEAARPAMRDTYMEIIDVHITGDDGSFVGTLMGIGGSGRVRTSLSVSLLRPGAHATINGLMLSGGSQRGDMKTNIQHVAQGTSSRQSQKNMVGGRATAAFRGRIRVEQSAQQTDSEQLSRTILLSDRSRVWTVPSLEIIADDVMCTHGATVSDLSEEESFYLRSRGLSRTLARNLLMYAFVQEVSSFIDPSMMGALDSNVGLQKRVIQRLENVVPKGERALLGDFQSV